MIKKITVSKEHVLAALEGYLKAMTMVDDDARVTDMTGSGSHYTIITEKEDHRNA